MNNKIIEVLDYLGEKIGIVVDWTAENIYPQVLNIMARYRAYEMICDAIWMLLGIGFYFGVYFIIKKSVLPARKRCEEEMEDNFWFESGYCAPDISIGGIIITAISILLAIILSVAFIYCLQDLIKWAVIPEMQFYEVIKRVV